MIRFECDYGEGAHEKILEKLVQTNLEQTAGYGVDRFCQNAAELIKKECQNQNVDVHFIVGGTQTNMIAIASALKPYQGVISADTGHINGHETGAVEATGHKVLTAHSTDGKITPQQIEQLYNEHYEEGYGNEHLVQPAMVYISQPTENGTAYSKKELTEISSTCKKLNLPLFADGARLGYALTAPDNDVFIKDLAQLTDMFYIGGTKVGALFGEALVIVSDRFKKDFRYNIKQRGAMLAKGRILGIQFETLFQDGLYYQIAKHAVDLAMEIKKAFEEKGIKFLYNSNTNQQFPILTTEQFNTLSQKYSFAKWQQTDANHIAARFCTSWATKKENMEKLIEDIKAL